MPSDSLLAMIANPKIANPVKDYQAGGTGQLGLMAGQENLKQTQLKTQAMTAAAPGLDTKRQRTEAAYDMLAAFTVGPGESRNRILNNVLNKTTDPSVKELAQGALSAPPEQQDGVLKNIIEYSQQAGFLPKPTAATKTKEMLQEEIGAKTTQAEANLIEAEVKQDTPVKTADQIERDMLVKEKEAQTNLLEALTKEYKSKNPTLKYDLPSLTARALQGTPEEKKDALEIIAKLRKDKVAVAGEMSEAQAAGKLKALRESIDVEGTALAVFEGRETIDNVRNTFGVPLQEMIRAEVLKLDENYRLTHGGQTKFNFAQAGAIAKSLTSSMQKQEVKLGAMRSFVGNINKQVNKLRTMIKDGKIARPTKVRILDKIIREAHTRFKGSGDEKVYEAILTEVGNEVQKLAEGATESVGQLGQTGKDKWESIHDYNLAVEEIAKVLDGTLEIANMRYTSQEDALNVITDQMGNIRTRFRGEFDSQAQKNSSQKTDAELNTSLGL